MDQKVFPITVEGKRLLEKELKQLLSVERPSVIQAIEEARAHGDLKENAEYAAAKERQSFIEGRIQHISSVVAGAQVIDPTTLNYPHIVFGATVQLNELDSGNKVTYKIVGVDEADITKNKVSIGSPIARALIGKKTGDEVKVITPKGSSAYEICGVEYR
jgi:transcription elongation factor GreA